MIDTNSDDLVRDFLQKIVDHLPIALFCKDARHNFQYVMWNETASRLWGFPLIDVMGKDDFELFSNEIATAFREKDKETMAARKIVYIPQEFVPTTEGLMSARTWKIPIYGEDGGPQWLLGISQDISEPRLVESRLPEKGPIFVALDANQQRTGSPAAQLAQEALNALEQGQTDLTRVLLNSIVKLG